MPDNSVHSLVTDPPYALGSIVKRFANSPRSVATENTDNPYGRTGRGFMGMKWDNGSTAFNREFWTECLRVLKPGGHVLAFGGTRTYHRLACAIEDAGFEIRDMIGWLYGSGFPKSHNLDDEFDGWGTALKPAQEPIVMARKPLIGTVMENMTAHCVGAINIDGCRIEAEDAKEGRSRHGGGLMQGSSFQMPDSVSSMPAGRWPANIIHSGDDEVLAAFPKGASRKGKPRGSAEPGNGWGMTQTGAEYDDSGSAARFFYCARMEDNEWLENQLPALAVGPNLSLQDLADAIVRNDAVTSALPEDRQLSVSTVLSTNVTPKQSRQIAESAIMAILHTVNGSSHEWQPESSTLSLIRVSVAASLTQTVTTTITVSHSELGGFAEAVTFSIMPKSLEAGVKDYAQSTDSVARFKYCAKASKADRDDGLTEVSRSIRINAPRVNEDAKFSERKNNHPTVKPTELMRYLCRLVTPPGGTVLDPFMGSGSTGRGAVLEGFNFIGVEQDAGYVEIARARIAAVTPKIKMPWEK